MTLRLSIENMDRLPDGGPLRIEVKGRGLDFGRDAHLDWTLPDPTRTVSSKHCEVRFRDGGYWLHDVSTNGTFVNGSQFRLDAPYLLRDSDRLNIGPYIIAVSVEGQRAAVAAGAASTAPSAPVADVWDAAEEAAAPDDRSAYQVQKSQPRSPDFLDFAALIETANAPVQPAEALSPSDAWLTTPAPLPSPADSGPAAPSPAVRARPLLAKSACRASSDGARAARGVRRCGAARPYRRARRESPNARSPAATPRRLPTRSACPSA